MAFLILFSAVATKALKPHAVLAPVEERCQVIFETLLARTAMAARTNLGNRPGQDCLVVPVLLLLQILCCPVVGVNHELSAFKAYPTTCGSASAPRHVGKDLLLSLWIMRRVGISRVCSNSQTT